MHQLFSSDRINQAIKAVGVQISKDYQGKHLLLIGILKGCTVFMGHLLPHISGDVEIDFLTVSSYGSSTTRGELRLVKDLDRVLHDKHVLIVEDIIDTGHTAAFIQEKLRQKGAASVEIVTFVNKETRRQVEHITPKYSCFKYEGEDFLIGFGFDYGEKYRNLPAVYTMPPPVK